MAGSGFILKWQRAVIEHLAEHQPTNHSSIVALVPVLVMHANPDGSKCYPSQEKQARLAGFRQRSTARQAMDYLVAHGFVEHVGNRARGLHEHRLQMVNQPPTDAPDVGSDGHSFGTDVGSDVGSDGHSSTTTSVPPKTSEDLPTSGGLAIAEEEAEQEREDGVLIHGEPITAPKALAFSRYVKRPGYYDDLATKRAASEMEPVDNESRAQLERLESNLVDAFSMDSGGDPT